MMITAPRLHALSSAWLLAILLLLAARPSAQCTTQWLPGGAMPGVNAPISAVTMWDADGAGPIQPRLVVAGSFTSVGNVAANSIATYDPVSGIWAALGTGMNNTVRALATLPNGDLVASGDFSTAGGVAANRIARWNGTTWSPFGAGMDNIVSALATLPNGDLVAAGRFTTADGAAANCVARWNGATWLPLGAGVGPVVNALAVLPNGDLAAGGSLIVPGGSFLLSTVARWDGTTWSWLGTGMGQQLGPPIVNALTTLPNGDLVAGGKFATADGMFVNCIARWNGAGWSGFGSGMAFGGGIGGLGQPGVFALTALANGDLIAGGVFTHAGGVPANGIARWNGSAWSPLGSGIGITLTESVLALAVQPNGDLVAGGNFTTAGGLPSTYLARLTTTCPAAVVVTGAGCPSSGGSNTLAATSLPWIGSTFRSRGTGLPMLAFVASVFGFSTTTLPLASVLPAGQPGCDLLVRPDGVDFQAIANGTAEYQAVVPNIPAIAGVVVHHQMIPFEVDPQLNFIAITATNTLQLTLGIF